MLFGLSNAAQAFQRMMDHTTDGLEDVFAYVDDSRVGSPDMFAYKDDSHLGSLDRQTHLLHLESFSTALATNRLAINLKKCVFAFPSLDILGHTVSVTGSAPTAGHALKSNLASPPQDSKQLQHFVGIVNFYCRFFAKMCTGVAPFD